MEIKDNAKCKVSCDTGKAYLFKVWLWSYGLFTGGLCGLYGWSFIVLLFVVWIFIVIAFISFCGLRVLLNMKKSV